VELIDISVENFRNLALEKLTFCGGTNIVSGANGAGKTSLLEAIVVLGNLKSFRTQSLRRAVRHGEKRFHLRGTIRSATGTHRVEEIFDAGPPVQRMLRVDGQEVSVARYLVNFPVFAITGPDRELVVGGPDERRALLDRLVFLLHPAYLDVFRGYRRALKQRNAALVGGRDDNEIEAWEALLAEAAARVVGARIRVANKLFERFGEISEVLCGEDFPPIAIDYRTEPWWSVSKDLERVEVLYQQRYNETRTRDRQTGYTGDGPHRHDLSLRAEGRSARYELSSGQAKTVAAALRLAALAQIEKERCEHFPVIVDDVDAELDDTSLTRLVRHLGNERQLFLSSTSDALGSHTGPETRQLRLVNGACGNQEADTDE
jgi:DNA replication and repair protein RecF